MNAEGRIAKTILNVCRLLLANIAGDTRIRNCVYAGSIKAPLGKRVGGLVGWVDNPGTVVENSIAICHAELGTDENSNSVVRCHDRSYVKLHNVFYVNDIKSGFDGAQKVSFEDLQNGRIFYQVLGSEIYSAEQQLDQYEQDLHVANVKLRLIAVIALLLALLLINLLLLYRYRRRQTRLLFQKLLVEHALWEGRQQRVLQTDAYRCSAIPAGKYHRNHRRGGHLLRLRSELSS